MNGIDISHHQQGIKLAAVPCDFVIMKASQGTTFTDSQFSSFFATVLNLGKKAGAYHFANGKSTGTKEADHFLSVLKKNNAIGKCILVLDWESSALQKGPSYALEWLNRVYSQTGIKPFIYMSKSVCRSYNWSQVAAAGYPLWMAQYANKTKTGYKANPWTDNKGYGAFSGYTIFQYTSTGRLSGYNADLDLDITYLTSKEWDSYCTGQAATQHATLRFGSRGDEVKTLQEKLKSLGYYTGSIDGIFGAKTQSAVKNFQKAQNLKADGIAGSNTWSALQ